MAHHFVLCYHEGKVEFTPRGARALSADVNVSRRAPATARAARPEPMRVRCSCIALRHLVGLSSKHTTTCYHVFTYPFCSFSLYVTTSHTDARGSDSRIAAARVGVPGPWACGWLRANSGTGGSIDAPTAPHRDPRQVPSSGHRGPSEISLVPSGKPVPATWPLDRNVTRN